MITEALLGMVVDLVEWLVTLLPDFGVDLSTLDFAGAWESIAGAALALNGWVPVTVQLGVAAMLLVVLVAMSGWGLVVWVYHQFWGSD